MSVYERLPKQAQATIESMPRRLGTLRQELRELAECVHDDSGGWVSWSRVLLDRIDQSIGDLVAGTATIRTALAAANGEALHEAAEAVMRKGAEEVVNGE